MASYRLEGNGQSSGIKSGLAMCSSGAQRQTEPLKAAKGRANSELRNVAPQGEAAAEAPKQQRAAQRQQEL
ncbi:hypothetical protein SGRA_3153 [Saprospira grandis str. Lewin]|uniref:Uncharacterized protein n=1 Tax=Saprospira grandis (strain Lewin) TaxID=984262 RepID=H6KZV5_SAPGL|nr:hypothetical protein SGRA_3153 [Saprospira grandis str. Lewin]